MSRRIDLVKQLIQSDKFGTEKENEQKFLMATAELILTDLINIAINGFEQSGPGSLFINMITDATTYMSATDVENDIRLSESNEDEEVTEMLRGVMQHIDENDWTTKVLITIISDAGTRTYPVEAGRSQECLNSIAEEFKG